MPVRDLRDRNTTGPVRINTYTLYGFVTPKILHSVSRSFRMIVLKRLNQRDRWTINEKYNIVARRQSLLIRSVTYNRYFTIDKNLTFIYRFERLDSERNGVA